VNDHGKDLALNYASPLFEEALELFGLNENDRQKIIDEVAETGSCQKSVQFLKCSQCVRCFTRHPR